MRTPNNLFLVGSMGAGKTTVGRRLANALDKDFVDCDQALEERTGASVSLIFDIEGEEGFRRREQMLLGEICERQGIVLATGGGAVLEETNRSLLINRGFVIYLEAPLDLLLRRTARDRARPLLQGGDREARIAELLRERDPLYREVADLVVATDEHSSRRVVRQILESIEAL